MIGCGISEQANQQFGRQIVNLCEIANIEYLLKKQNLKVERGNRMRYINNELDDEPSGDSRSKDKANRMFC